MTLNLTWIIFSAAAVAVMLIFTACWKSNSILSPAKRRTPLAVWPDQFKLPFETVEFTTSDGLILKGWFIPSVRDTPKTIIMCHGWGGNRGDLLQTTNFLHDAGFNLFYFDFRASGESQGAVSSVGYLEAKDFEAALEFLRQRKPETEGHIGAYGTSMGGSVAIYSASRHPELRCVLVEDAFCSYNQVVGRWGWIKMSLPYYPLIPMILFFVRLRLGIDPETFSPIYKVDKISPRPVMFIHGDLDALVPVKEIKRLFHKAGNPKDLFIVPGAAHGKCSDTGGEEYRKRVSRFFNENL